MGLDYSHGKHTAEQDELCGLCWYEHHAGIYFPPHREIFSKKIYHFLWRAAKKLGGVLCDDICFGRFMRFRFQLKAGSEGL